MKKILLLTLFLALGCLELGGQACPVSQYLDQGVAITYIGTDFEHIMSGNTITLSFDMTNLGEATAEDISAEIIGPDNFYILNEEDVLATYDDKLYPPDPDRCLEGNAISGEFELQSRSGKQTPEKGTPIRLRINYKYTSRTWADLIVMSKEEWDKSTQSGERPRGNTWDSAAPVKVKITVPDTPLVPDSDAQAHPIRIKLEYALAGEIKATAEATTRNRQICAFSGWRGLGDNIPNCVDEVKITLQEGLAFDIENEKSFCGGLMGSLNCKFGEADAASGVEGEVGDVRTAYLSPAKVSPDKARAEEYVLWVKVTKDPQEIIQENLKVYADATYYMETVYETSPVVIGHVR